MDKNSRNIVKFIATITVAALLIMAARFYARSQEEPMPVAAEETAKPDAAPEQITDDPLAEAPVTPEADPENPAEELIEEDAELIMGEPSMNLEQGGSAGYAPPPAQAEPPIEQ